MLRKHRKRRHLGARIRQAISTVSVDVFGVEDKVNDNILKFFRHLAEELDEQTHQVKVRIHDNEAEVRVVVLRSLAFSHALEFDEVARFFVGDLASDKSLQDKIKQGIHKYLELLATEFKCPRAEICIQISLPRDKPAVQVFVNNKYLKDLSVKSLIQHFL